MSQQITATQLLSGLQDVFHKNALPCPAAVGDIMQKVDAILDHEQSALCDYLLSMRAQGRAIIDIGPEELFWLSVAGFYVDLETGEISLSQTGKGQ